MGDRVLDAWQHPKFAFLIGLLAGIFFIGMLVFAPPETFQQTTQDELGEKVVGHYENRAPTGLQYELVDVEHHGSGLYEVNVNVMRGTVTTEETVYITSDGKWVFDQPPSRIQPQLSE